MCSLMASVCSVLSCEKYSPKISNGFMRHIHLRLLSDHSAITKRSISFPDFECHSTNIQRTDPSDALQYPFYIKNNRNKICICLLNMVKLKHCVSFIIT